MTPLPRILTGLFAVSLLAPPVSLLAPAALAKDDEPPSLAADKDPVSQALYVRLKTLRHGVSARGAPVIDVLGLLRSITRLPIQVEAAAVRGKTVTTRLRKSGSPLEMLARIAKATRIPMTISGGVLVVGDPSKAVDFLTVDPRPRGSQLFRAKEPLSLYESVDPKARLAAIKAIAIIVRDREEEWQRNSSLALEQHEYHQALHLAATDESDPVAVVALDIMARHPIYDPSDLIFELVQRRQGPVRTRALEELLFLRLDSEDRTRLEELGASKEPELSRGAARALTFQGCWDDATERKALDHPDPEVRLWAGVHLIIEMATRRGRFGDAEKLNAAFELGATAEELKSRGFEFELFERIRRKDRRVAAHILGFIRLNQRRPLHLRKIFRGDVFGGAYGALHAKPDLPVPLLTELLAFQLEHGRPVFILNALKRYGDAVKPALDLIAAALCHREDAVARSALALLGSLEEEARPYLGAMIEVLEETRSDQRRYPAEEAVSALGAFPWAREAFEPLLRSIESREKKSERYHLLPLLGSFGEAATPRLIRYVKDSKREPLLARKAVEGLGRAAKTDVKAQRFLIKLLAMRAGDLSERAYRELRRLGPSALPVLEDARARVRDARVRAKLERIIELIESTG